MWRCANNFYGYCAGSPDFKEPPKPLTTSAGRGQIDTGSISGGLCSKDPASCGFYRSNSQLTKELEAQHA